MRRTVRMSKSDNREYSILYCSAIAQTEYYREKSVEFNILWYWCFSTSRPRPSKEEFDSAVFEFFKKDQLCSHVADERTNAGDYSLK